jgi:hypothetical protein
MRAGTAAQSGGKALTAGSDSPREPEGFAKAEARGKGCQWIPKSEYRTESNCASHAGSDFEDSDFNKDYCLQCIRELSALGSAAFRPLQREQANEFGIFSQSRREGDIEAP